MQLVGKEDLAVAHTLDCGRCGQVGGVVRWEELKTEQSSIVKGFYFRLFGCVHGLCNPRIVQQNILHNPRIAQQNILHNPGIAQQSVLRNPRIAQTSRVFAQSCF